MFKQKSCFSFFVLFMFFPLNNALSENNHMHHHGMMMDMNTMVMGENKDRLPDDCDSISEQQTFTIKAGRKFATQDDTFAYDVPIIKVKPCARVTVTLDNDDQVRHQWMMHGLPRYLYDGGMFHLEANGRHQVTGTFIVPSHNENYFTHCDIAQHTEKGLIGEVIVGSGKTNITDSASQSNSLQWHTWLAVLLSILGFVLASFLLRKNHANNL